MVSSVRGDRVAALEGLDEDVERDLAARGGDRARRVDLIDGPGRSTGDRTSPSMGCGKETRADQKGVAKLAAKRRRL